MKSKKRLKYQILSEWDVGDLNISVQKYLDEGWKLNGLPFTGDVFLDENTNVRTPFVFQLVVKKEFIPVSTEPDELDKILAM